MKQDTQNDMKFLNANWDFMQVFVIINKDGIRINADVNAKNWLAKECVIKYLLRILAFECECNKSSDVRLFLYYCKCRKIHWKYWWGGITSKWNYL